MQATAPLWDHQYAHIGCLILTCIALVSLGIYWVRNARTWPRALMPFVIFFFCTASFVVCFRFVRFTGELVPIFAWRFSKTSKSLPVEQGSSDTIPTAQSIDPEQAWSQEPMSFPEFLGPGRRAYLVSREFDLNWERSMPQVRWQQAIGAGWCGFVISGDRCFTMEERQVDGKEEEWITSYSIADGKMIWHFGYPSRHYHPFGGAGPRATPTLSGDWIIAQGATGVLSCLKADTGELIWQKQLHDMLGLDQQKAEESVPWGRSGSPLVDGKRVIVPLGGSDGKEASLVAFSLEDGKEIWRGGDRQISYASPALYEIEGRVQIVSVNEDNASGHDPETGKVLWDYPWEGKTNTGASVSQAMLVGTNRLLLSKGYGGGSALIELMQQNDQWTTNLLWHHSSLLKTKFTNAVVKDSFAYALSDGILECANLESGKSMWKQPRRDRFGQGQVLGVEDVLLVLSEQGTVAIVALDPNVYRELGRFDVLEGTTWNTLALSKRTLIIRNSETAACIDLPARQDRLSMVTSPE